MPLGGHFYTAANSLYGGIYTRSQPNLDSDSIKFKIKIATLIGGCFHFEITFSNYKDKVLLPFCQRIIHCKQLLIFQTIRHELIAPHTTAIHILNIVGYPFPLQCRPMTKYDLMCLRS